MNRVRILLVLLCVAAAIFAGLLAWRVGALGGRSGGPGQVSATGTAAIGGPFTLTDQDGKPVTEAALKGRWSAVFFGFTYCPDVCPGTLQALKAAAGQIGDKTEKLQVVFISVDPERDTPQQMKDYLEAMDLPVKTIGMTGTPEQVAAAAKAYRAYYKKNGEGEGYLVDHSTAIYLMNPQGQFDRVLAYGMTPDQMAVQLNQAIK
ncbi:SCO family protein [Caulobacter segnis]|uniref:SCO family protein n=1 Tax=Caulobacter segnis TaxID=88688 RepID=UPI00240FEA53|nr:SCO family protein [Caulobacter segnis]MDG2521400.1 SCO family protein [Caulobacter segnis]